MIITLPLSLIGCHGIMSYMVENLQQQPHKMYLSHLLLGSGFDPG